MITGTLPDFVIEAKDFQRMGGCFLWWDRLFAYNKCILYALPAAAGDKMLKMAEFHRFRHIFRNISYIL